MTCSLALIGPQADALWRESLTGGDGGLLLDFSAAGGGTEIYRWNIWGWRRWLRQRGVERVSWYEPDGVTWPVVWAARWEKIPVDVHVTSERAASWLRPRRRWMAGQTRYITPVHSWAAPWGTDSSRVELRPVRPQAHPIEPARIRQIQDAIDKNDVVNGSASRPLRLLTVSRPGEKGLRLAVWTASMVRYVAGEVRLVIVGRVTPGQRRQIEAWERMWGSEGLCFLAEETYGWEETLAACDVVLAGGPEGEGWIRLAYAQAAGNRIVTVEGENRELLGGGDRVHFVDRACARELAGAVLDVVNNDSIAMATGETVFLSEPVSNKVLLC